MLLKEGVVLISREKHSCKVKFVEGADDTGILLVDGIKDEFFTPSEFHLLEADYRLLCKREDRKDAGSDFNFYGAITGRYPLNV